MKIQIGTEQAFKNRDNVAYNFTVTHGSGGGIYTGATVNRNERWGNVIDGIDCVVVGHTHKGTVTRPSKLVFDPYNNKVSVKDYLVISCVA
jgi:predicted phosphodiesterase